MTRPKPHSSSTSSSTLKRAELPSIDDREFNRVKRLIEAELGIGLAENKKMLVIARLGPRLRALKLDSFEAYLDHVDQPQNALERARLLECLCTHETSFFRERWQFEFLKSDLIPLWISEAKHRKRRKHIRIWSAACSSGEEPYSLAMCLHTHLQADSRWDIQILATDASQSVLETAQRGLFPWGASQTIPKEYLHRYVLQGERTQAGSLKIVKEVRDLIKFETLNLYTGTYPSLPFDAIFCRNVLIYFSRERKQEILERMEKCLKPAGFLFFGHAEGISGVSKTFKNIIPAVYQLRAAAQ